MFDQDIFIYLIIIEDINSKFVFAKDVRQVLSYVETENVDAGIVYVTDANQSRLVKIIATAPAQSHSPVVYPVAVMQSSKNVAQAKSFTEFLLNKKAVNVYQKYGFKKI